MTKIRKVLGKATLYAGSSASSHVNRSYNRLGNGRANAALVCGVLTDITLIPKYASVASRRALWRNKMRPQEAYRAEWRRW